MISENAMVSTGSDVTSEWFLHKIIYEVCPESTE